MASKKPSSKQSMLSNLLKAPIKLLIRARDFYIQSMTLYADKVVCDTAMMCPITTVQLHTLPRSFSVGSTKSNISDDDYKELVRAASKRSLKGNKIETDTLQSQKTTANKMARSRSIGIGRIDEEKSCRFDENVVVVKNQNLFRRSQSYAVSNRRPNEDQQWLLNSKDIF